MFSGVFEMTIVYHGTSLKRYRQMEECNFASNRHLLYLATELSIADYYAEQKSDADDCEGIILEICFDTLKTLSEIRHEIRDIRRSVGFPIIDMSNPPPGQLWADHHDTSAGGIPIILEKQMIYKGDWSTALLAAYIRHPFVGNGDTLYPSLITQGHRI
jgi:hypothetical protein